MTDPPVTSPARPVALGTMLPGPILFARFAFPPNRLGLCGPETGDTLPERVRSGHADLELRRIAQGFEGAWPYLELIAAENDIADPLDHRVVEAYWLGNALLAEVGPKARYDDLAGRFRPRTTKREWPWLAAKAASTSVVHHSFHVLEILPRVGMIRGGPPSDLLGALERCLVRPGRVIATGDDAVDVELSPLELRDGALAFGSPLRQRFVVPAGEAFGDQLRPGDDVAIHWDRVCGRLDDAQVKGLRAVTDRNLAVANQTL